MKRWIYKTLAVAVAFLTFGVITPEHEIWAAFDQQQDNKHAVVIEQTQLDVREDYLIDDLSEKESPIDSLITQAKEQSYIKFGSKIAPVITEEFDEMIFPKISEAIEMTVARLGEKATGNLTITQTPSGDYKEKIFNIYSATTGKDVIRFHVRIENRPFEGHYYNFHYHTADDHFVAHYNLGEIFWSKNTPPKWLS